MNNITRQYARKYKILQSKRKLTCCIVLSCSDMFLIFIGNVVLGRRTEYLFFTRGTDFLLDFRAQCIKKRLEPKVFGLKNIMYGYRSLNKKKHGIIQSNKYL